MAEMDLGGGGKQYKSGKKNADRLPLKPALDDAWEQAKRDGVPAGTWLDVRVQVFGENPISDYRVILTRAADQG